MQEKSPTAVPSSQKVSSTFSDALVHSQGKRRQEAHLRETGVNEALSGQERPEPGVMPPADPLIPGGWGEGEGCRIVLVVGRLLCTLSSPQKTPQGHTPPGPGDREVAGALELGGRWVAELFSSADPSRNLLGARENVVRWL